MQRRPVRSHQSSATSINAQCCSNLQKIHGRAFGRQYCLPPTNYHWAARDALHIAGSILPPFSGTESISIPSIMLQEKKGEAGMGGGLTGP